MLIVQSDDLRMVRTAAWTGATLAAAWPAAHMVVGLRLGDEPVDLVVLAAEGLVLLDVPEGDGSGADAEAVADLARRLGAATGLRSVGGLALPGLMAPPSPPVLLTGPVLAEPQTWVRRLLAEAPGAAPGELLPAALAAIVGEDAIEDDPAAVLGELQGWMPTRVPAATPGEAARPAGPSPTPTAPSPAAPPGVATGQADRALPPPPHRAQSPAPAPSETALRAAEALARSRDAAARRDAAAAGQELAQAEARRRWPLAPDLPLRLPAPEGEAVAATRHEEMRAALLQWPAEDLRLLVAATTEAIGTAERGTLVWAELDRGLAALRDEARRRRVVLGLPVGRRPGRGNTLRLALQRALAEHVADHAAASVRLLTALEGGLDPAALDITAYARLRRDADATAARDAVCRVLTEL